MRYLFILLTITSIIVSTWYTKDLKLTQERVLNETKLEHEKEGATYETKYTQLNTRLTTAYDDLKLEKEDYDNKISTVQERIKLQLEQERQKTNQNKERAERDMRRKQIVLAHRNLSAKEWEITLATFKKRRKEIAQIIEKNREQITINTTKLSAIIAADRKEIGEREDATRRAAQNAMAIGRAGGRGTSYAIIETKEAMEKKHQNLTRAVTKQNQKLNHSIQALEEELVRMDKEEENFMNSNSPHQKRYDLPIKEKEINSTPIVPVDGEIIKLQNLHKRNVNRIQNSINFLESERQNLYRKWNDFKRITGKERTELREKQRRDLQNATFTGYAAIGLFSILSLFSFALYHRLE